MVQHYCLHTVHRKNVFDAKGVHSIKKTQTGFKLDFFLIKKDVNILL